MISVAFRMVAEELAAIEHQNRRKISRNLRDSSNPLELPQNTFQKYFRVNKCAFKYLLNVLTESSQEARKSFAVTPIVKLSACLRFFAEGAYQTGVGKDHDVGLAQSSFCKVLANVLDIFERDLCSQWIRICKRDQEKRSNNLTFYIKHGIPGVVGCIDGTHIRIIAPSGNKHLYYNRKGYYSLNVMLVCNDKLTIQYVNASHPGACHDAFIWNVSDLRSYFEEEYLRGIRNSWLLGTNASLRIFISFLIFFSLTFPLLKGDAGYPLEPWLMTPYRVPNEGSAQRKFNDVHSQCRNVIERTNGVLKNRWRCLLGARELHYTPQKAAKIINVCCALHNICIRFKVESTEPKLEVPVNDAPLSLNNEDVISSTRSEYLTIAQNIRDGIPSSL